MAHKCNGCRYKGEHQEMMFRPFGVCTKELNLIEAEKAYNAEKCPYKITNADCIRAMSDEELADELASAALVAHCEALGRKTNLPEAVKKEVFDSMLEWLKQPAEG